MLVAQELGRDGLVEVPVSDPYVGLMERLLFVDVGSDSLFEESLNCVKNASSLTVTYQNKNILRRILLSIAQFKHLMPSARCGKIWQR